MTKEDRELLLYLASQVHRLIHIIGSRQYSAPRGDLPGEVKVVADKLERLVDAVRKQSSIAE